jgi:hypothetical protein
MRRQGRDNMPQQLANTLPTIGPLTWFHSTGWKQAAEFSQALPIGYSAKFDLLE